jgi:hypothetical protein
MNKIAIMALGLMLSACGDSTGPKSPNLAGSWSYNATNLAGGGLSCSVSGVIVSISQTDNTFTGTYSPGTLSCVSAGSAAFSGGTVVNGTITGTGVNFNFDTQDWAHNGSLSGNSVSGTTTMRLVLSGGQTLVMNGTFAMAKN